MTAYFSLPVARGESGRVSLCTASFLLTLVVGQSAAQQPITGFSSTSSPAERILEGDVATRPSAASASAHSRALSAQTHVAGTRAQAATRDYVIRAMKRWGLDTEVRSYDVWMPHATSVRVARVSPKPKDFVLVEPPVAGDPTSGTWQYPTVNGYSGQGDVTEEVVYANYGLIEDYAQLDSMDVSVKGKIVIARYGRSFRGIKAREAEKHGAVGLLIYSDPQDDGYARGDVYPAGPMRPSGGVQRGSILNLDGDPSTPGYAGTTRAPRLKPEQMEISHIPVVPIAYGNASELLRYIGGKEVPQAWQGGLPFRYHVGPVGVRARVAVRDDRATTPLKPIYDTFGTIRGSEFPDELVIIGGHRDAWGPGTADNVSGTVSVLEMARAISEEVRAGHRPRRTILFATWDAEEWGLLGSTEFVEDDSLRLSRDAVSYFNQDVAAQGARFGGGGSPSLRGMLRDVAKLVPDPSGQGSVYEEWRRTTAAADSTEPPMGDPGGGSDFAGFYNHLGIPIADWGFGGNGGVYHSQYDSYTWMTKFGDPGFRYHAAAARIGAVMTLRMANADVLPFDYAEYARTLRQYVAPIERRVRELRWSVATGALATAIDELAREAVLFNAVRDSALKRPLPNQALERTNRALMQVERALARPEGLRTRPWFRNLIYVADENNGYANMPLPSINEAIRAADEALTRHEIEDLVARFARATSALTAARAALTSR